MSAEWRIIRKVQRNGDREAADALVRLYYPEIYRYVLKQTSDKQVALDLTQSIFISMLQSIANFQKKQASFRTWLYRIATNKTIDYYRSRARESKYRDWHGDYDIAEEPGFADALELKSFAASLQTYLDTMDVRSQQILRLKVYGEYTFHEIAGLLALPESTVKSKYFRLIKKLREAFQDEWS